MHYGNFGPRETIKTSSEVDNIWYSKKTIQYWLKKKNISQCACSGIHVPDKRDNCQKNYPHTMTMTDIVQLIFTVNFLVIV